MDAMTKVKTQFRKEKWIRLIQKSRCICSFESEGRSQQIHSAIIIHMPNADIEVSDGSPLRTLEKERCLSAQEFRWLMEDLAIDQPRAIRGAKTR